MRIGGNSLLAMYGSTVANNVAARDGGGIYAYDAYVLHCARALSCPLLTLDARMRKVGAELKITMLEQE